jgi:hypothetical protein
MGSVGTAFEIAKPGITAYNDKDWSKAKELLAPDAVYDKKGTQRRIEGAGGRSHRPTADANRYHPAIQQVD